MPGSCRPPAPKPGPTHLDPLPLALLWFPLQPGAELRLQLRAQLLHHQVAQDLEAGGTAGTGVGLCLGVLLSTEGQARPRGSLLPCGLALCSMSPLVSLLSIIPTGPAQTAAPPLPAMPPPPLVQARAKGSSIFALLARRLHLARHRLHSNRTQTTYPGLSGRLPAEPGHCWAIRRRARE